MFTLPQDQSTAAPIGMLISGDAALSSPTVHAQRASTKVADIPIPCRYGFTWCHGGQDEHGTCEGDFATVFVPGHEHPIPVLDTQILNLGEGGGTVLTFAGSGQDACQLTPAEMRATIAQLREHLDRMEQITALYEQVADESGVV